MNQKKLDVLEKCIELIEAGVPVEECITKYPELSQEMHEILTTAREIWNLRQEQVPAEAMNRSLIKLLSQAKQLIYNEELSRWQSTLNHALLRIRRIFFRVLSPRPLVGQLLLALMITVTLIVFSRGLVITSAKSLPGDSLYPIKRAVEDIRVYLVPNREVRHEYEENYSQQRMEEVKNLIGLRRIQQISFEGVLETKEGPNWSVSGIPVTLSANTTLVDSGVGEGSFVPGAVVEVEGYTNSEGSVTANEIHLHEYQFIGLVEDIKPNLWQISGTQFSITSKTQIDEGISIGDYVTVLIRSEDNGLYALAILLEERPESTSTLQPLFAPTRTDSIDPEAGIEEDYQLTGTLEKISDSYWVVSGQIVFTGSNSELSSEIKVGDLITVYYKIEANGSFTVEEVKEITTDYQLDEPEIQSTSEEETEGQNELISSTPSNEHKDETSITPEDHITPEPTKMGDEVP